MHKHVSPIIFSAVFSLVMVLIPWEKIWGSAFVDRMVYTNYFLYGVSVLEYSVFDTWLSYITKEYLWHALIGGLVEGGVNIDTIFNSIAFMLLFSIALFVTHKAGYLYVLFLVNPMIVEFAHSQLRLALAVFLLLLAYALLKYKGLPIAVACGAVASLIHTASVLILLFWLAAWLVGRYSSNIIAYKSNLVILLFFSLFCSFLLGPAREVILSYIGDRRADYKDMSSSLTFMSFWICLLGAYFVSKRTLIKSTENRFSFIVLAVACGNYLFGFYSQRFLVFGLPFIIAAISEFSPIIRLMCIFAYIVYATLQWIYWLRLV
jgi:EpsG-like putative glucosyltransferase